MPRVRLPNGELRDEIKQNLYDTIDIVAAENPQGPVRPYFTNIAGKTRSQTNLRTPGQLEAAVSFRTQGLTWQAQNYVAANRRALSLIMEHSVLSFKVGEKEYYVGNATFVAGRIADFESVNAADASVAGQQFGRACDRGVILGADAVVDIPPLQTFRVDWQVEGMSAGEQTASTPAAGSKLRFILSLHGLLRRPVQ